VRGMGDPKYHDSIMSPVADKMYEYALRINKNPEVRRTAGGPGSGKTEMVLNPLLKDFNGIVLDKLTGSMPGFIKDYNKAVAAGKGTNVFGVVPDLEVAKAITKKRVAKTGRVIPDWKFNEGHAGAPNTLLEIARKFPDVGVYLKDTRGIKTKTAAQMQPWEINRKKIIEKLQSLNYTPEKIGQIVSSLTPASRR
jgi:hypothetical protein